MSAAVMTQPAADRPARPAPDEVAENLHPSMTRFLVGHQATQRVLAEAAAGDRMHHAWLLTGPPGIGKATLAYRTARHLLSGAGAAGPALFGDAPAVLESEPDEDTFAQVASGSHPNLLRLTRGWDFTAKRYYTVIRTDDVRRLGGFLGQKSTRPGRRVVIVDSADDLQFPNAGNALLKPLEEPPADTVFLLVAHQPGGLLPTIRSRCRRLDLRPPTPVEALEALQKLMPEMDAAEAELALAMSEQAPGRAIRLMQQGGVEVYRLVLELFRQLPTTPRQLAEELTTGLERGGEAERGFRLLTEMLDGVIRRLIGFAADGVPLPAALSEEQAAAARFSGGGLEHWFDMCDNLQRLRNRTDALHLNRKAVVLTLVSALETTARRAAG